MKNRDATFLLDTASEIEDQSGDYLLGTIYREAALVVLGYGSTLSPAKLETIYETVIDAFPFAGNRAENEALREVIDRIEELHEAGALA